MSELENNPYRRELSPEERTDLNRIAAFVTPEKPPYDPSKAPFLRLTEQHPTAFVRFQDLSWEPSQFKGKVQFKNVLNIPYNKQQTWTVGKTLYDAINPYIKMGILGLQVTRKGFGMKDTVYEVQPLDGSQQI
jgi:hypothetical protein